MTLIDRLRKPKYIGENRCIPCTIVNVAIAAIASTIIATKSRRLGGTALTISLGTIHLRGYLVPGTPTLTKRYFPDRVLRWFDKKPTSFAANASNKVESINPEQVLLNACAVKYCENGTDLCLRSDFRTSWREQRYAIEDRSLETEKVLDVLNDAPDDIWVEEYGDALAAGIDDKMIGQWPSSPALIADIAATEELAKRYPNWEQLSPIDQTRVLRSLRIFIEECPECNGPVRVEQEVVDSCCTSYNVVISACQDCEAQLFEIEWDDEFTTASDAANEQSEPE